MTNGVSGTAMAAFGQTLSRGDFNAVADYVARLNGVAPQAAGRGAAPAKLTAAAERGQTLFSEAARGFGRCSTCHEVQGRGLAVAAPIRTVPVSVVALKGLTTPRVVTAMLGGESMPALVVAKKSASVVFYDLTSAPPVLRTSAPAAVETKEGSPWRHAAAVSTYTDAELTSILAYLRAVPSR
jgi:mono/diheme cytochrome c family protein